MENEIFYFLSDDLGLKGKYLEDMRSVIKTEKELNDFKKFIIDNDGKFRTSVQLVFQYLSFKKEDSDYTKDSFVKEYISGQQRESLSKVFSGSHVNDIVLNKVEKILEKGLTLEKLYDILYKYRIKYSLNHIVSLILTKLNMGVDNSIHEW